MIRPKRKGRVLNGERFTGVLVRSAPEDAPHEQHGQAPEQQGVEHMVDDLRLLPNQTVLQAGGARQWLAAAQGTQGVSVPQDREGSALDAGGGWAGYLRRREMACRADRRHTSRTSR